VSPVFQYCATHGPVVGRCKACERERVRQRGTTSQRGYGRQWRKISEEARRLHPYCAVPGCTSTDLTVDHVDPRTRGKHGLTLADVQVLCRFHNSSKGAKSYRVEGSTTSEDAALWVL
jgi:5-methylcytosine-specific restriction endonuclease McrA